MHARDLKKGVFLVGSVFDSLHGQAFCLLAPRWSPGRNCKMNATCVNNSESSDTQRKNNDGDQHQYQHLNHVMMSKVCTGHTGSACSMKVQAEQKAGDQQHQRGHAKANEWRQTDRQTDTDKGIP